MNAFVWTVFKLSCLLEYLGMEEAESKQSLVIAVSLNWNAAWVIVLCLFGETVSNLEFRSAWFTKLLENKPVTWLPGTRVQLFCNAVVFSGKQNILLHSCSITTRKKQRSTLHSDSDLKLLFSGGWGRRIASEASLYIVHLGQPGHFSKTQPQNKTKQNAQSALEPSWQKDWLPGAFGPISLVSLYSQVFQRSLTLMEALSHLFCSFRLGLKVQLSDRSQHVPMVLSGQ